MSIFDWAGFDLQDLTGGTWLFGGTGDAATARIAEEQFRLGIRPDVEGEARLARSRWLEQHRAEYSFPCGVVPEPEPPPEAPRLNVVPRVRRTVAVVIAAVLPSDLVFLLDQDTETVEELGRIPRTAIRDADVVDPAGAHVPEPAHESFESVQPALLVLRWSNDGVDEEERFAFRSVWLAWKTARKLLEARRG
ncbi:MAG: hypothetical protein ACRDG8_07185 [Actinomycetota bacterium]